VRGHNKLCGRPPQPMQVTFWPWKWCRSHVWRGLPLCQFLVFLGLSVLELGPLNAPYHNITSYTEIISVLLTRVVFVGGKPGNFPLTGSDLPSHWFVWKLRGNGKGRGGKGEKERWGRPPALLPPLASASNRPTTLLLTYTQAVITAVLQEILGLPITRWF